MKTFSFVFLCYWSLALAAQTTEFAPLGARWLRKGLDWSFEYNELSTVIGDTLIMGNNCRIIEVDNYWKDHVTGQSGYAPNTRHEYVYTQGDKVYYYRNGSFYTLYNFGAQVGDTWTIRPMQTSNGETGTVKVDSIGTEVIDGMTLRYLWISATSESCYGFYYQPTRIVERVGMLDMGVMFPNFHVNECLIIDAYYGCYDLTCYQDADIMYGIGDSCSYVLDTQNPNISNEPTAIAVHYQPATAQLLLSLGNNHAIAQGQFELYDLQGKQVNSSKLPQYETTHLINIADLPNGIYVYAISNHLGTIVQRGKVAITRF